MKNNILILLALTALVACVKKPDMTPNYGPAVSISDIQKAVSTDAPINPLSIRKGQFISLDENQVIDTGIPTLLSQRSDEVTDYIDTPTTLTLKFNVVMKELIDGAYQTSTNPYTLEFDKVPATVTANSVMRTKAGKDSVLPMSLSKMKKQDADSYPAVTYHNLARSTGTFDTPISVLSKPNCGHMPNCLAKMRFLQVSFDRVVWDSADHGTKTAYTYIYSPDMPTYIDDWTTAAYVGFTNLYKVCAQTFVTITQGAQTQVVPVTQCAEIRDFQFGAP